MNSDPAKLEAQTLSKTHFEYVLAEPENKIRKSKIICTIGYLISSSIHSPSCWSVDMLCQMLKTGMNVARFNFSHGNHAGHKQALDNLREAMKKTGINCATMLDTKGPEIRTGMLKEHKPIVLKKEQLLEISKRGFYQYSFDRHELRARRRRKHDHMQLEEPAEQGQSRIEDPHCRRQSHLRSR